MFEAIDALARGAAFFGRQLRQCSFHALDALGRHVDPRLQFILDEHGGETAEFQIGHVVIAPVASLVDHPHGPEGTEEFQPLTGRAQTNVQAGHDFVHRHGFGRDKKEAINFTD